MNSSVFALDLYVRSSFRQTAVGLATLSGKFGGMVSPLVNMLAVYHWSVPIVIFSSLTMLSGFMGYLLPETRGTELPDSVEEAEGNG